jgi:hypothetical protein
VADRVTISNQALSLLGEDDQLTDPEDDTHAARTIKAVWDVVREAVLREGEWNFATLRAELGSVHGIPPGDIHPYAYAYNMPDGWLRLVEVINPPMLRDSYSLESNRILADVAGPIFIRYVRDVPETGQWDATFVNAFAHRLAYQIAERITGDRNRKADCWSGYRAAIGKATGADAVENPPTIPYEDDWITARWGGSSPGVPNV